MRGHHARNSSLNFGNECMVEERLDTLECQMGNKTIHFQGSTTASLARRKYALGVLWQTKIRYSPIGRQTSFFHLWREVCKTKVGTPSESGLFLILQVLK